MLRQGDRGGEIGHHRRNLDLGVAAPQILRGFGQEHRGNVDRHIGREMTAGIEQPTGLDRGAGAEFDQRAALGHQPGQPRGVVLQDRRLGPGQVIFRQGGDLLEECAATLIIKPLGAQHLLGLSQPAQGIVAQGGSSGGAGLKRTVHQATSRASRSPIICQR